MEFPTKPQLILAERLDLSADDWLTIVKHNQTFNQIDAQPLGNQTLRQRYGITPLRLALVHLGLFVILAGSLFDIATGREHWPFSPYPMFSSIEMEQVEEKVRLYGVPLADNNEGDAVASSEFPLLDAAALQPFDQARLSIGLRKLQRREGNADLRIAMNEALARYEALRQAGQHEGPPLRAVRLYELSWTLDPLARNVAMPDERTLVLEVERD